MSAQRQFQRSRILAQPGPGRSRRASGPYRDQSSGAHECRAVAAYLALFRTPGDLATPPAQVLRCKREPEAVAARRRAAPSGRASRPSDGTVSHLGALHALFAVHDSVAAAVAAREQGGGRARLTAVREMADMPARVGGGMAFRSSPDGGIFGLPKAPARASVGGKGR